MEVEEGFEVCRVCLTSREATPLFSIFLLNGYDAGMMRDLAGIDVSQDEGVYDGLICSECAVELQEVHNFMAAMREAEINYFRPKREEVYEKECQKDGKKSKDDVRKVGNNSKEGSVKQIKVRVNYRLDKAKPKIKNKPKRNIKRNVKIKLGKKIVRPFQCSICLRAYTSRHMLRYHIERIHAKVRRFQCDLCQKLCFFKHQIESHLKWHKSPKNNPLDSSRPYQCTHKGCKKYFKRRDHLECHLSIHIDYRPFVCYCKKAFKFKGQLKTHQRQIHGKISKNLR